MRPQTRGKVIRPFLSLPQLVLSLVVEMIELEVDPTVAAAFPAGVCAAITVPYEPSTMENNTPIPVTGDVLHGHCTSKSHELRYPPIIQASCSELRCKPQVQT